MIISFENICNFLKQAQFSHNQCYLWSSKRKQIQNASYCTRTSRKQPGPFNKVPEKILKYTSHAELVWPTFQLCQPTWYERNSGKKMCML